MRRLLLGFGAFVGLALLGVSGCAEDAEKAANVTGVPAGSTSGGGGTTQDRYLETKPKAGGSGYGGQGYPGSK